MPTATSTGARADSAAALSAARHKRQASTNSIPIYGASAARPAAQQLQRASVPPSLNRAATEPARLEALAAAAGIHTDKDSGRSSTAGAAGATRQKGPTQQQKAGTETGTAPAPAPATATATATAAAASKPASAAWPHPSPLTTQRQQQAASLPPATPTTRTTTVTAPPATSTANAAAATKSTPPLSASQSSTKPSTSKLPSRIPSHRHTQSVTVTTTPASPTSIAPVTPTTVPTFLSQKDSPSKPTKRPTSAASATASPTLPSPASAVSPTFSDRDGEFNSNSLAVPPASSSRPPPSLASARSSPTPPKKHAPARFSSNGVATSDGPPPSLAYRRFSMEHRGSTPATPSSRPTYTRDHAGSSSASNNTVVARPTSRSGSVKSTDRRQPPSTPMSRRASYSSFDGEDDYDDEYGENDRTIRGLEDLQAAAAKHGEPAEDVFLKLARTDSVASKTADRIERRRARLSRSTTQYRNSLPTAIQSSPVTPASVFNSSPPQVDEDAWRRNARMSSPAGYGLQSRRLSHADDQSEERTSVTPRASFGSRPGSLLRREASPGHSRSFSMTDSPRSHLANRAPTRVLGASPQLDDKSEREFAASVAGAGEGGKSAGSASTVSTTAASSVWDELDDLKSRIRRLEVTGHIPASSRAGGASNSSGDRPRTATTTVTTVSSSPRNNANGISPINSSFNTPNATTSHPLLHTALAKSKAVMPPDVYKHLELAAKDALDLANTVGAPGSTAPNNLSADRTVRRKADAVCRSLTELCLALSENKSAIAPAQHPFIQAQFSSPRPMSRGIGAESVLGGRDSFGRDRDSSGRESVLTDRLSRVGRYAERKNSLASLSVSAGYSPRSDPITSPTTVSALRHRGSLALKDEERLRAPSRAVSEVNAFSRLNHSRLSHPLTRDYSAETRSPLPPRRSSLAPSSYSSPLAPSTGSKRFFSESTNTVPKADDFTISGGPINDRIVSAAANQESPYVSRRTVRQLRDSVDLDSGRSAAVRRAEAATERLLRR